MSINNVNIMFEETKQMKGIDVRDTLADMFSLGDWFFFQIYIFNRADSC
jgi:hypothetical protein